MKLRVRVLLLMVSAVHWLQPAGRATDTLDFTGRLSTISPANIFRDPGYYVWCGSSIRGEAGRYNRSAEPLMAPDNKDTFCRAVNPAVTENPSRTRSP